MADKKSAAARKKHAHKAVAKKGKGKVEDLFKAEDVWTVE